MNLIEEYRKYYHALAQDDPEGFFTHFDGGKTAAEYFQLAAEKWHLNFMPYVQRYLMAPDLEEALDIGYGGGGMVKAATKMFRAVCGIDVHHEGTLVAKITKAAPIVLARTDGHSIGFEDGRFGFVFSWVTFLHLDSIRTARAYLRETYRVLRPGGIAVIYFSHIDGVNYELRNEQRLNVCNLRINGKYMARYAKTVGFTVKEHVQSKRRDGAGKQRGIVLAK